MSIYSFYPDLSPYSHQIAPFTMQDVKNVGWVNPREPMTSGPVSESFLKHLTQLAVGSKLFQAKVEPIRELPSCPMCGPLRMHKTAENVLPNCELWFPANNCFYAAPVSILHYIEHHHYCPPSEFINAINDLTLAQSFSGEQVYRKKLLECGWFDRDKSSS